MRTFLARAGAFIVQWIVAPDPAELEPEGFAQLIHQLPDRAVAVAFRRGLSLAAKGKRFKTREAARLWAVRAVRQVGAEDYPEIIVDVGELEETEQRLRFYPRFTIG